MASVSSLDKDMRNIRLSKYTPQAANEVRTWIDGVLGEPLAAGDLLGALKDGIALCKLINLASPSPGVRFKASTMPFVQMENISHFLRACQQPPIGLHSHDIFQTVDLYESKDPAQVLQCIAAFSRRAHAVQPTHFPNALGGEKSRSSGGGAVTPQGTGGYSSGGNTPRQYGRPRGASNTSETSSVTSHATSQASSSLGIGGRGSPNRASGAASPAASASGGSVSSWSKRQDEGATMPAWNIHQYGYMGGASQGNQGITFGGRRQITSPAPKVPSMAEKERKRREQEEEAERVRMQEQEADRKRTMEREADEERDRAAEERRWEEETRKQRERERLKVEEEKRRWEEEERRWKEEEQVRAREEKEAEARSSSTPTTTRPALQGQFLSQYQAEQQQKQPRPSAEDSERKVEGDRVKELERQLEEAKEREAQYERERGERIRADGQQQRSSRPNSQLVEEERYPRPISIGKNPTLPASVPYGSHMTSDADEHEDERSLLKQAWQSTNARYDGPPLSPSAPAPAPAPHEGSSRPLPSPRGMEPRSQQQGEPFQSPQQPPPRPLPNPQSASASTPHDDRPPSPPSSAVAAAAPHLTTRPLPNPANYTIATSSSTTPSHALPSPTPQSGTSHSPTRKSPFTRPPPASSMSTSSTHPSITPHPQQQQHSTLLSNEISLEQTRHAEWATDQAATAATTRNRTDNNNNDSVVVGPTGESWDVHQYGYLGGDSQNKGSVGIGMGGGRRQVLGVDPGVRSVQSQVEGGSGGGGIGGGDGQGDSGRIKRVGGPREMPR